MPAACRIRLRPISRKAHHADTGTKSTGGAPGRVLRGVAPAVRPRRADGPLRIAYLGVDAHTALARFLPMLATHHDRSRFHAAFFYGASDEATLADARQVRVFGPEPRAFLGSAHIVAGELISTRLLSPSEVQGLVTERTERTA